MRIAFVGAPGSGKTVLCNDVFAQLKKSGRKAELVHEWIRHDIQINGPMTSIWEQYRTRQHQKELEDAVPSVVDYVVVDGGLLLQYYYAALYVDPNEPRQRLVLHDMYRYLLDDLYLGRYDLIFYVPMLHGCDLQDGTRYQSDAEVRVLDQHMALMFTKLHRLANVHTVNAGFEHRLEEVMWWVVADENLTQKQMNSIITHRIAEHELEG